jgi:hypothetical protein
MPFEVGALRRSQVVTSYGPGATIDLPEKSVIIGGLDWWRGYDKEPIIEPRLAEKAAQTLGLPRVNLYAPPAGEARPGQFPPGIPVVEFPLWFVADYEQVRGNVRSRPLVHKHYLENGVYRDEQRRPHDVTPVRFVMACRNGHIADIEWYEFVHSGRTQCRRPLWMDEYGTSGDLTDLVIRCECGQRRPMAQATTYTTLGVCKGQRPWLPRGEQCQNENGNAEMMRLLIRTASNAYFAQKLSALSLPQGTGRVRDEVERYWNMLAGVQSAGEIATLRGIIPSLRDALADFDDAVVLQHVVARREGQPTPRRPIKIEEFDALMQARETIGEDVPDGDFYARRRSLPEPRPLPLQAVDRVILVHRLRVVTAQLGFTRFEAVVPDMQGELDIKVRRAALAMEPTWIPAVETRGEGVFIAFRNEALDEWRRRSAVRARAAEFQQAHAMSPHHAAPPPDITWVMLHSLAHLLISAVSLDCGYAASSLRERVYVTPSGAGILLYTGTSDAEGTLGGLVQVGNRLEYYLRLAQQAAQLCSYDPVCAQHSPSNQQEARFSMGAACHGCLLIGETSCEARNELLDRALVVSTVQGLGCEFLPDPV